jgi:hypothetical protein
MTPAATQSGGARSTGGAQPTGGTDNVGNATGTVSNCSNPINGHCVTILGTDLGRSDRLALDAQNVYFTSSEGLVIGHVGAVPKAGGAITVLASNQQYLEAVAVSGNQVYWALYASSADSSPPAIFTAPVTGGAATTLAWRQSAYNLVADANNLYWANSDAIPTVNKMAHSGGPITTLATAHSPLATIHVDAVDTNYVYWLSLVPAYVANTTDDMLSIMKVPIAGGDAVTLATLPVLADTAPDGPIVVDASNVYWTIATRVYPAGGGATDCSGAVWKVSLDGGTPVALAQGQFCPAGGQIAVDATNVYWVADEAILTVPVDGGAPSTFISRQNIGQNLAVDTTSVYFTVADPTTGQGQLVKASKD